MSWRNIFWSIYFMIIVFPSFKVTLSYLWPILFAFCFLTDEDDEGFLSSCQSNKAKYGVKSTHPSKQIRITAYRIIMFLYKWNKNTDQQTFIKSINKFIDLLHLNIYIFFFSSSWMLGKLICGKRSLHFESSSQKIKIIFFWKFVLRHI